MNIYRFGVAHLNNFSLDRAMQVHLRLYFESFDGKAKRNWEPLEISSMIS